MMPRNRLDELQAASKHAPITEEEEMKPLKDKKAKEGDSNFEAFLDMMEEVVANVDKVEKNTLELRTLQRKLLVSTHKDDGSEKRMEDLMAENKRLAKMVRKALKDEQDKYERFEKQSPKKRKVDDVKEWKIRNTQVAAQSGRFFNIWNEYNTNQVEYRDKSKKLLVKRCKITNSSFTDDQIEEMLDEGNTAVFAKGILDQENMARQQLSDLQDRHDEFIKLEKSIVEVHDMFIELANLVTEQGEMIDNIEANVNAAQIDVEGGKKHLSEAEKHQKSARKKKLCCAILLIVVILIVVLVILSEFGLFSSSDSETKVIKQIIYVTESTTTSTTTLSTTRSTASTTLPP